MAAHQKSTTITPAGRWLLFALTGGLLLGCGLGKERVPSTQSPDVSEAQNTEDWFCQPDESGEQWDCVQSDELAKQPRPTRAATPRLRDPIPEESFTDAPQRLSDLAGEAAPVPPLDVPPELPIDAAEPAYVSLSYRPDQPQRLTDLPDSFYTAQLFAVSTKAQIEDFVTAEGLYNMSATRIEKDGELLYVLLLGVYATEDKARMAVASMPVKVRELDPWVRPIKHLQQAMLRAEKILGTQAN